MYGDQVELGSDRPQQRPAQSSEAYWLRSETASSRRVRKMTRVLFYRGLTEPAYANQPYLPPYAANPVLHRWAIRLEVTGCSLYPRPYQISSKEKR